jgi:hypothetical protein
MKAIMLKPVEVEVSHVRLVLPVRHEDEVIPYNFPNRTGDKWEATIEIDSGKVIDWKGDGADYAMEMKVVDNGCYYLLSPDGSLISSKVADYVPNNLIPGSYGDYVELKISNGVITNWITMPSLSDFADFRNEDE